MYESIRALMTIRGFSESQASYILWGFEDVFAALDHGERDRRKILSALSSAIKAGQISRATSADMGAVEILRADRHVTLSELAELCDAGRIKADGDTLTRLVQLMVLEYAPHRRTSMPRRIAMSPAKQPPVVANQPALI